MPVKILVVEDDPHMLGLLKAILTDRTGYEVDATAKPQEISKILQEGRCDLVVTDLKMPLMEGLDLIEFIKGMDPLVPIIVIAPHGASETAQEAIQKGAYDFIAEPFRQESILITIRRALEWRRMQGELAALNSTIG